jgi:UDP-N-acetylglucosamine--N-acetylmuramyl-(pentapeptide) pyrophosphoryl-undecaprenol N-acetylglucosamine transferase
LRGKNPIAALKSLWILRKGYQHSIRLIQTYQPDVLFVTGGYVCVPVTLAASRANLPVLIYLPDIEPGLAIKFLARYARRVAVSVMESKQFFRPNQTVVTGYPVRSELVASADDLSSRTNARRQLGFLDELPLLLIFGGSRGARSINRAVAGEIQDYLAVGQLLHITGPLDFDSVQARWAELPAQLQARYQVKSYLHDEMVTALLAADLVVSRAGASVLGEFPVAGLPAVLVPYPYAGAHQALNANYLARHGAAEVINDADLARDLKNTVIRLLTNPEKLQIMRTACQRIAVPEAADRLANEILEVRANGN